MSYKKLLICWFVCLFMYLMGWSTCIGKRQAWRPVVFLAKGGAAAVY